VREFVAQNEQRDWRVQAILEHQTEECLQWLLTALWHDRRRVEMAAVMGQYCRLRPADCARWAVQQLGRYSRRVRSRWGRPRSRVPSEAHLLTDQKFRLHLGCGEVYLPGYVNIDYPPDQHTVQQSTRADRWADVRRLEYEANTVQEIRLHHLFEHFDRPTALQLLLEWYDWLTVDGCLTIETPDFTRSLWAFLLGSRSQQFKVLRHLYGSQEARWAIHYDGWYRSKYELVLTNLGYRDLHFRHNSWHGTYNIVVTAYKRAPYVSREERRQAAEELLRLSLVDDAASEQRLLHVWLEKLRGPQSDSPA
jgi:hypothetical protein